MWIQIHYTAFGSGLNLDPESGPNLKPNPRLSYDYIHYEVFKIVLKTNFFLEKNLFKNYTKIKACEECSELINFVIHLILFFPFFTVWIRIQIRKNDSDPESGWILIQFKSGYETLSGLAQFLKYFFLFASWPVEPVPGGLSWSPPPPAAAVPSW